MPYKSEKDRQAWLEQNRAKQAEYRRRWEEKNGIAQEREERAKEAAKRKAEQEALKAAKAAEQEAIRAARLESPTKRCGTCKEEKPKSEFRRDKTNFDGLMRVCKPCNNAAGDRWRERNPKRAWMIKRTAKIRTRDKIAGLESALTVDGFAALIERFDGQCFNCGSKEQPEADHHYPKQLGFKASDDNMVLLCKSCNSSKQGKLPEAFYSSDKLHELRDKYGIAPPTNRFSAKG